MILPQQQSKCTYVDTFLKYNKPVRIIMTNMGIAIETVREFCINDHDGFFLKFPCKIHLKTY